jgi:PIN domain nuclease of toxin-antitoxin system
MDVILDTCGLLSLVGLVQKRLSRDALDTICFAEDVYVSSCSMFEIALKHKKHGLELGFFNGADVLWRSAMEEYELTQLPVSSEIFYDAVMLPDYHADPFDRLIIAQAKQLTIPVVSFDGLFERYGVAVIQ